MAGPSDPPFTRAGGQDDVSYTNSLKLLFYYVLFRIAILFLMFIFIVISAASAIIWFLMAVGLLMVLRVPVAVRFLMGFMFLVAFWLSYGSLASCAFDGYK